MLIRGLKRLGRISTKSASETSFSCATEGVLLSFFARHNPTYSDLLPYRWSMLAIIALVWGGIAYRKLFER